MLYKYCFGEKWILCLPEGKPKTSIWRTKCARCQCRAGLGAPTPSTPFSHHLCWNHLCSLFHSHWTLPNTAWFDSKKAVQVLLCTEATIRAFSFPPGTQDPAERTASPQPLLSRPPRAFLHPHCPALDTDSLMSLLYCGAPGTGGPRSAGTFVPRAPAGPPGHREWPRSVSALGALAALLLPAGIPGAALAVHGARGSPVDGAAVNLWGTTRTSALSPRGTQRGQLVPVCASLGMDVLHKCPKQAFPAEKTPEKKYLVLLSVA